MKKNKKILTGVLIALIVAVLLHFIPVYSKEGYIQKEPGSYLCQDYPELIDAKARILLFNFGEPDNFTPFDDKENKNEICSEQYKVEYYLL